METRKAEPAAFVQRGVTRCHAKHCGQAEEVGSCISERESRVGGMAFISTECYLLP
jgi:hypothetical protein